MMNKPTECNSELPDFAYYDWLLERGWLPEEIDFIAIITSDYALYYIGYDNATNINGFSGQSYGSGYNVRGDGFNDYCGDGKASNEYIDEDSYLIKTDYGYEVY
jgi:hypothetical protein